MRTDTYRQAAIAMMGTGLIVTAVTITLAATGNLPEWGRATLMTVGVVMLIIGKLAYVNARQAENLHSKRHEIAEIRADLKATTEQILAIAEMCTEIARQVQELRFMVDSHSAAEARWNFERPRTGREVKRAISGTYVAGVREKLRRAKRVRRGD